MTACARCGAKPLPHTQCCLECGLDAEAEIRPVTRTVEIAVDESTQREPLIELLRVCAPQSAEILPRIVDLGTFEIAVEARPQEIARLEAACLSLGARAQVSDRFSTASRSLVWDWSGGAPLKMLTVIGIGAAAEALAVPLIPIAAVMGVGLLVWRAVHAVERRITVSPANMQTLFRPIDPALFANMRRTRERLANPDLLALFGQCADAYAELSWLLRADGASIANRSLRLVDARLRNLMSQTCAIAQAADGMRNSSATPRAPAGRDPDSMSVLTTIRDRLVSLQPPLSESRTEERRREAVASAMSAVAEIDEAIQRAAQRVV
jgi:hypothetical protein